MDAPLQDVLMANAAANNAAMIGIGGGIADLRAVVDAANQATQGLVVANHAVAMEAIAANHATSVANHAVAMGAIAANHATSVANHAVAMETIAANHATSVANHAVAMGVLANVAANQVAMMAAIAALGDAEHVGRSFGFQAHIKVVRAANSCVRDFQSSIVPMPLAPADPLLPGVFAVCPLGWPAAGYTISDLHRLTHAEANALIGMYALPVGVHGVHLPDKKNAILVHFGLEPCS
jgi:hypothetical protein